MRYQSAAHVVNEAPRGIRTAILACSEGSRLSRERRHLLNEAPLRIRALTVTRRGVKETGSPASTATSLDDPGPWGSKYAPPPEPL